MVLGISTRRKDVLVPQAAGLEIWLQGKSMGIWLPTCRQACVTINVKTLSVDVRHRVLHNILADPESSRVRQLLDVGRWAKRYM